MSNGDLTMQCKAIHYNACWHCSIQLSLPATAQHQLHDRCLRSSCSNNTSFQVSQPAQAAHLKKVNSYLMCLTSSSSAPDTCLPCCVEPCALGRLGSARGYMRVTRWGQPGGCTCWTQRSMQSKRGLANILTVSPPMLPSRHTASLTLYL